MKALAAGSDPPPGGGSGSGGGGSGSPTPTTWPRTLPPSARDGSLVVSDEGHLYVLAGQRLFWFNRADGRQLGSFQSQAVRLTGGSGFIPLHHDAVHAIEVNRNSAGQHVPGANMPNDNIFLYEYGTTRQYVIKFQHPFPIGGPDEVITLGGQDKAVMVPRSLGDLQQHPPQWVRDDLLRFYDSPTVWHFVDRGFRVPGVPVRDCLMARWQRGVTLMPSSAWNSFPAHPTQPAACDFTHGQWLYGEGSKRQVQVLYSAGHYVQYGEVAALGGVDKARAVSDFTIGWLTGRPFSLPEHHLYRAGNSPDVYMVEGGRFHKVGSPPVRDCLMASYGTVVEAVPQSFIDRLPKGDGAQCPYEGRLLLHPNGVTVDYIKNGQRHHVQNPTIRDCLMGRAGTGPPISVEQWVWDGYPQGAAAFCPYPRGANFIQENGDPTVWLVSTDGTKRHVGRTCLIGGDNYTTSIPQWRISIVPAGETAGHVQGADWWATAELCHALPVS
jgi:hypothetical protein